MTTLTMKEKKQLRFYKNISRGADTTGVVPSSGSTLRAQTLAEAEKGRMEVDPVSGEELQRLAQRVMDQPADLLARVKKLLEN